MRRLFLFRATRSPTDLHARSSRTDAEPVFTYRGHTAPVTALVVTRATNTSDAIIVSASLDSTIRLWRLPAASHTTYDPVDSELLLAVLETHGDAVWGLADLSDSDKSRVACITASGSIQEWNLETGEMCASYNWGEPDAASQGSLKKRIQQRPTPTALVTTVVDAEQLLVVAFQNAVVKLFRPSSGEEVARIDVNETYGARGVSPLAEANCPTDSLPLQTVRPTLRSTLSPYVPMLAFSRPLTRTSTFASSTSPRATASSRLAPISTASRPLHSAHPLPATVSSRPARTTAPSASGPSTAQPTPPRLSPACRKNRRTVSRVPRGSSTCLSRAPAMRSSRLAPTGPSASGRSSRLPHALPTQSLCLPFSLCLLLPSSALCLSVIPLPFLLSHYFFSSHSCISPSLLPSYSLLHRRIPID